MKYWIVCKKDEISKNIENILTKEIQLLKNEQNPDLVIVIGGDGTFISAVHQFPNAIFLGIHTGHLGFYANYTVQTLPELIENVNKQNYIIEKVDVLECEFVTNNQKIHTFALNEVTIIKPPKTLLLNVYVDDEKLETFRGTGLCISTAYGSTAYNKSLFGAVVEPNIKAFQITEIAGINSNQFRTLSAPLVLSNERKIKLEVLKQEEVFITIDHLSYHFKDFSNATVQLKTEQISLAHPKQNSFIERIKRTFLKD
ncbi:MAG: NAD kinase [Roseburia sp.]|nr:NAD kinase [Anaeroplasma bactoclasticum]MCM1195466.1 NAD kinase [Roseburia sp.]MCM1555944.1 NAD kinase [Anaeroplasma bactoclasticum]